MKVVIEIQCDNAAFHPNPADEVGRILAMLADKLDNNRVDFRPLDGPAATLHDLNGNRVGAMLVLPD